MVWYYIGAKPLVRHTQEKKERILSKVYYKLASQMSKLCPRCHKQREQLSRVEIPCRKKRYHVDLRSNDRVRIGSCSHSVGRLPQGFYPILNQRSQGCTKVPRIDSRTQLGGLVKENYAKLMR